MNCKIILKNVEHLQLDYKGVDPIVNKKNKGYNGFIKRAPHDCHRLQNKYQPIFNKYYENIN